ncbi:MAG TPA: PRC-barrel domain-containing protein [Solirubrobacteraceae bacterium]|nr:PRC-barrel domain-containing protein [Solirubrobacteraceae bacterium]
MASVDIDTALAWRGRTVRDPDGEKLGTLGDIYLDRESDLPEWASIRTGLFGRRESHVPLSAIEPAGDGDGDDLRVPYTKAEVEAAPRVDPDVALDEEEERVLYEHYGREYAKPATSDTGDRAEMIRSEEEVEVHEGPMRPTERVRLRKVLVTDHEERTIPVRKEVVQLETEPPPSGRIEHVEDVDR